MVEVIAADQDWVIGWRLVVRHDHYDKNTLTYEPFQIPVKRTLLCSLVSSFYLLSFSPTDES